MIPSAVVTDGSIHKRALALLSTLSLALATRAKSVRWPSCGPTARCRENISRARGRDIRAKISPSIEAVKNRPVNTSALTMMCP